MEVVPKTFLRCRLRQEVENAERNSSLRRRKSSLKSEFGTVRLHPPRSWPLFGWEQSSKEQTSNEFGCTPNICKHKKQKRSPRPFEKSSSLELCKQCRVTKGGMRMLRTYSDLVKRSQLLSRFRYLKLEGEIGAATFGYDRPLNQAFYSSYEWKRVRDLVIIRDQGCDMGLPGFPIHDKVLVHHMNPMIATDILHGNPEILNPEFLICVSTRTHNAIHFGDESQLPKPFVERTPGDTKLW